MGKDKLRKFKEMKDFNCVFEPSIEVIKKDNFPIKDKWRSAFFKNQHPIVLELGCGKGEYTVGLAKKYPEKNFIGIDIKGARIWRGAKTAEEDKLNNVAFLRSRIEFIESFFGPDEVDELWLTFSDPQPKKENKRLSSPIFLEKYKKFLKKGGVIHLKTDSLLLYEYTIEVCQEYQLEILENTDDVYGNYILDNIPEEKMELLKIRTHYEQLFSKKGFNIKYLSFKIN